MKKLLLYLFSHRTLALLRWDIHFLKVRIVNKLLFRRARLNRIVSQAGSPVLLNLGSGPRGLKDNHWINIDGFTDQHVHYVSDFGRGLPFNDNTFDGIFCEHVLEHFTYDQGKTLMKECVRVLKKGGVIRIIVPDGEIIVKSYLEQPAFIVKYKECKTSYAMEAVNAWFYQRYEHQCIYDAGYLSDMLFSVGFTKVEKSAFSITVFDKPLVVIDDEKYKWESLYVEAIK